MDKDSIPNTLTSWSSEVLEDNIQRILTEENIIQQDIDYENNDKPVITIQTHNGRFHCDDVTAVSLMSSYYQNKGFRVNIVRSRDPKTFTKADMLLDVGCEYDPERLRFDHHQSTWSETYDLNSDIAMSSVGTIWKHFGKEIIQMFITKHIELSQWNPEQHLEHIQKEIYYKVILEIDANDNGIPLVDNGQTNYSQALSFPNIIDSMNYNQTYNDVVQLEKFGEALKVAGKLLDIKFTDIITDYFLYLQDVEQVKDLISKSVKETYLILPKQIYTIFKCLDYLDPDCKIKFIIFPNDLEGDKRSWTIRTRSDKQHFQPIIPLLSLETLKNKLSYPTELLFVHKNLFVAKTSSLKTAEEVVAMSLYKTFTTIVADHISEKYQNYTYRNYPKYISPFGLSMFGISIIIVGGIMIWKTFREE